MLFLIGTWAKVQKGTLYVLKWFNFNISLFHMMHHGKLHTKPQKCKQQPKVRFLDYLEISQCLTENPLPFIALPSPVRLKADLSSLSHVGLCSVRL